VSDNMAIWVLIHKRTYNLFLACVVCSWQGAIVESATFQTIVLKIIGLHDQDRRPSLSLSNHVNMTVLSLS
jgi:hypothetical protein